MSDWLPRSDFKSRCIAFECNRSNIHFCSFYKNSMCEKFLLQWLASSLLGFLFAQSHQSLLLPHASVLFGKPALRFERFERDMGEMESREASHVQRKIWRDMTPTIEEYSFMLLIKAIMPFWDPSYRCFTFN